ncbi:hypothetical protein JCM16163A_41120 [Paenibacillus sp. YK5]
MKEDERKFLIDVYQKCKERIRPRRLIEEPGFYMNHKRAWRILEKWDAKGWYEYGVTLDLGWLTDEGKSKAEELIKETP